VDGRALERYWDLAVLCDLFLVRERGSSLGLVEAGSVLTEPVGADEGVSPARPGVFWGSVPVRGWGVARGLGGSGRGDRGNSERNGDIVRRYFVTVSLSVFGGVRSRLAR
jgi:hypothetical protein